MSLPAMLGMLGGAGALPPLAELVRVPCARCVAELPADVEPNAAQTMAAGSLVCIEHARRELGRPPVRIVKCADPITPHPAHVHSVITDGVRYNATCLGFTSADPFGGSL